MEPIVETERLILRKIGMQDLEDLFEMDADPAVHQYIDNDPVTSKEQISKVIDMINRQYDENGIGRWAVVDKQTNECVGWCGLKYFREPLNNHSNIYELGYRFKQKHWGKGYASESAAAMVTYGFATFDIATLYAMTHPENTNSIKVLQKLGFKLIEQFIYDGCNTNWFELDKTQWAHSQQ